MDTESGAPLYFEPKRLPRLRFQYANTPTPQPPYKPHAKPCTFPYKFGVQVRAACPPKTPFKACFGLASRQLSQLKVNHAHTDSSSSYRPSICHGSHLFVVIQAS